MGLVKFATHLPREVGIHIAADKISHKVEAGGSSPASGGTVARRVSTASARRTNVTTRFTETFGGRAPPRSWSANQIEGFVKNPDGALRSLAAKRGLDPALSRAELAEKVFGSGSMRTAAAPTSLMQRIGTLPFDKMSHGLIGLGAINAYHEHANNPNSIPGARTAQGIAAGAEVGLTGTAIAVGSKVAQYFGVNPVLANAAQFAATAGAAAARGARNDADNRVRGAARGLLQSVDITGLAGKPMLVDAFDRHFGSNHRDVFGVPQPEAKEGRWSDERADDFAARKIREGAKAILPKAVTDFADRFRTDGKPAAPAASPPVTAPAPGTSGPRGDKRDLGHPMGIQKMSFSSVAERTQPMARISMTGGMFDGLSMGQKVGGALVAGGLAVGEAGILGSVFRGRYSGALQVAGLGIAAAGGAVLAADHFARGGSKPTMRSWTDEHGRARLDRIGNPGAPGPQISTRERVGNVVGNAGAVSAAVGVGLLASAAVTRNGTAARTGAKLLVAGAGAGFTGSLLRVSGAAQRMEAAPQKPAKRQIDAENGAGPKDRFSYTRLADGETTQRTKAEIDAIKRRTTRAA